MFAQPRLIAAHQVRWHSKLGVLCLVPAPSMAILDGLTLLTYPTAHNLIKLRNYFLSKTWKYLSCSR